MLETIYACLYTEDAEGWYGDNIFWTRLCWHVCITLIWLGIPGRQFKAFYSCCFNHEYI